MSPDFATPTVLVVDDDKTSRLIVERFLSGAGHPCRLACSAEEALAVLREQGCEAFAAVVTDYWMPGGTGVDLMRQAHSLDSTLAFVLITAEGEKDILTEMLRGGGFDYLEKPVSGARLQESVANAIVRTREQRGLRATAEAAHALGRQQARLIERHSAAVRDRVALFFHSHTEASGDFAAVFPAGPDRLLVLASDTSGHDLSSAFHANYFHGFARGMISHGAGIPEVFQGFNRQLLEEWNAPDTVLHSLAAAGMLIDLRQRRIELMNCGFPYPLTAGSDGWGEYQFGTVPSSPLGWFADLPPSSTHALPDGSLILWSDGLAELAEQLDVDPLCLSHRLLRSPKDGALLKNSADDILVMRIGLAPAGPPAHLPLLSQDFRGSDHGAIDPLVQRWDRSLRLALPELADERLADITVCAREAVLNALTHGCDRSPGRSAGLRAAVSSDGLTLRLRVRDDGPGHDFDAAGHEAAAAEQMLTEHRGLVLLRHLPDRIAFAARGSDVTMTFSLASVPVA
ncbi:MAG: response regulator [Opitutales bacterium]